MSDFRRLLPVLVAFIVLHAWSAPARAELFVVDAGGDRVLMYHETTGAFQAAFVDPGSGGLQFPRGGAAFGPDGNFYVTSSDSSNVLRYSGLGGFLGVFADATTTLPGFGHPTGLAIRGEVLYVADETLSNVKTYNVRTGAFVRIFATGNGLSSPQALAFGPDGHLYVTSQSPPAILRFNGTTGTFIGALSNGAGGLADPRGLAFGPGGKLYVADPSLSFPGRILRYNVTPGAFETVFVSDAALQSPRSVAFGPDGDLYVGDSGTGSVRRYDGTTGAASGVLVAAGSGGLSTPAFLLFAPACPDSDADGVPDASDTCAATPAGSFVDANGCPGNKLEVAFNWWGLLGLTVLLAAALPLRRRRSARG